VSDDLTPQGDGTESSPSHDMARTSDASWGERMFANPGGTGVRWSAVIVAALVVVALVAVGVTWFTSHRSESASASPGASASTNPGPVLMSHDDLRTVASATGHTVYWAGARGLQTYEVTMVGNDIYVRYLPAGVAVGSTQTFLTVGTYEKADAYASLVTASTKKGAKSEKLAGGALVVVPADKPTSAYFAFQGANLLMEVFDPTPGAALTLVTSGAVQPIT